MMILRYLLIALAFALPPSSRADTCENEMKNVTALLRVIQSGLKLGETDADILRNTILNSDVESPFAVNPRSIWNLSLRQTFARYRRGLKPVQFEAIRISVREMIAKHEQQQGQVEESKQLTKQLVKIAIDQTVGLVQQGAELTKGTFEGRPVFIGTFLQPTSRIQFVMIDYFRKDHPEKKIVPFGEQNIIGDGTIAGTIFQWQGKDYFARHTNLSVYDLTTGKHAKPKTGPWPDMAQAPYAHQFRTVNAFIHPSGNDIHFVADWHVGDSESQSGLVFWNSKKERPNFDYLISGHSLGFNRSQGNVVSGEMILPHITENSNRIVTFFNLTQGPKKMVTVTVREGQSIRTHASPLPISIGGRPFALIHYSSMQNGPYKLGLFSLEHGQFIRDVEVDTANWNQLHSISQIGRANILLGFSTQWIVLDGQTLTPEWSLPGSRSSFRDEFHWRGVDYLLMTGPDNTLELREIATGILRDRISIPSQFISNLMTFEADGIPRALVAFGPGTKPIFLKLVEDNP